MEELRCDASTWTKARVIHCAYRIPNNNLVKAKENKKEKKNHTKFDLTLGEDDPVLSFLTLSTFLI